MQKLQIQSFLGKLKEVNLWKSVLYKLGKHNKALQNLSKNGQRVIQKKFYAYHLIQPQRELLLVLMMVLLMSLL
jgi:hypothetical protein